LTRIPFPPKIRPKRTGQGRNRIKALILYGSHFGNAKEIAETIAQWLRTPGVAGLRQAKSEALGLKLFAKTLRCVAMAMKGPLQEGEAPKIGPFIGTFAKTITK
jgi:flavorubredoxin